jgi:hypothetical protein
MKKNVGNLDKLIRLILAVVIVLFFYNGGDQYTTKDIILLLIAFVLALTSLLNYCPIYSILGINTNKKKE